MNDNIPAEDKIIKRRPGGRSARVREAVLKHALAELREAGYLDFSIARLAKRANVHETTIYRRWHSREELIIEAVSEFAKVNMQAVDTGNLYRDLHHCLHTFVGIFQSEVGRNLILLSFTPHIAPEVTILKQRLWDSCIHIANTIFEQAVMRGEWPSPYDHHLLFSEAAGPLLAHYFVLQQPISDEMIRQRVQAVLSHPGRYDLRRRQQPE